MFNFFKKKEDKKEGGLNFLKNALSKTADSLVNSVIQGISGNLPDEFELDDIGILSDINNESFRR